MASAKDRQVGGDHYSQKAIQPIDYIMANNLDFCEGNVVKYISRWREKGGIKDLDKIIQYVEFLKEQAVSESIEKAEQEAWSRQMELFGDNPWGPKAEAAAPKFECPHKI